VSAVRLYVDEDACESAVVSGLLARGIDILTTIEVGRTGTSDREQLEFAIVKGRSIYTLNVADFATSTSNTYNKDATTVASLSYQSSGTT
jgi:hypothetical protein